MWRASLTLPHPLLWSRNWHLQAQPYGQVGAMPLREWRPWAGPIPLKVHRSARAPGFCWVGAAAINPPQRSSGLCIWKTGRTYYWSLVSSKQPRELRETCNLNSRDRETTAQKAGNLPTNKWQGRIKTQHGFLAGQKHVKADTQLHLVVDCPVLWPVTGWLALFASRMVITITVLGVANGS